MILLSHHIERSKQLPFFRSSLPAAFWLEKREIREVEITDKEAESPRLRYFIRIDKFFSKSA